MKELALKRSTGIFPLFRLISLYILIGTATLSLAENHSDRPPLKPIPVEVDSKYRAELEPLLARARSEHQDKQIILMTHDGPQGSATT